MMDELMSTVVLNRQRGLATELAAIANNVANLATTGFRREGVVFAEFVAEAREGDSVSIGDLNGRFISGRSGRVTQTGRTFDLAIEGEGYFMVERNGETLLTRAGAFQTSPEGALVTPDGDPVLDLAGGRIFIPPNAVPVEIGEDGTISGGGRPLGQVAIVRPPDGATVRAAGAALRVDAVPEPIAVPRLRQGALEGSNVEPVTEIARMIEVTRAYERAQALIEDQDSRIRKVMETLGRAV